MTMKLFIPVVNTCEIPHTTLLLQQTLPSIFRSQCFNDANLTFSQEVKRTEIGHLFEHILLEYLCITKLANGFHSACFSGKTDWNWKRDKRGTFHINVALNVKDLSLVPEALQKSIYLLKRIIEPLTIIPAPLYQYSTYAPTPTTNTKFLS